MRPVPIPDGMAEAMGGVRTVIGDDDPTDDRVQPCEYVVTRSAIYDGKPCVTALIDPTPAERAAIADGARLLLTLDGGELPWTLAVEEHTDDPRELDSTGVFGPSGAEAGFGVNIIDTSKALILEEVSVVLADEGTRGQALAALSLSGRVNQTPDRATVVAVAGGFAFASLIADLVDMAAHARRSSSNPLHREWLDEFRSTLRARRLHRGDDT